MNNKQNSNRILIFLTNAFGLPWIAVLVISKSRLMANNPTMAGELANYIFILTPWLASIIARLVSREGWRNLLLRPNFKCGWRFYLAAWFLPLLATIVGGTLFFLLYPNSFDANLGVVLAMVESSPSQGSVNPWMILLSTTGSLMLISIPVNTVVSIGEEFGWRAYLLPKLMRFFTRSGPAKNEDLGVAVEGQAYPGNFNAAAARKAAILTGVIHGVWHFPLLFMTGSLVPEAKLFSLLGYVIFTSSLSVLLSWVTLCSGSVWPASVGHGAVNATSILPGYVLKGSPIPLMGPDVSGLIGGIGFTILALVLLLSRIAFACDKGRDQIK